MFRRRLGTMFRGIVEALCILADYPTGRTHSPTGIPEICNELTDYERIDYRSVLVMRA